VDTPLLPPAKLDVAASAPNQDLDFASVDPDRHSDPNGYQSKTRSQPKILPFLTSRQFTCLWNGREEWFRSHKSRLTSKRLYSEAFAQRSKILSFGCHFFSLGSHSCQPSLVCCPLPPCSSSFAGRSGPQFPSPPSEGSVVSGKSGGGGSSAAGIVGAVGHSARSGTLCEAPREGWNSHGDGIRLGEAMVE
jgi:hypothetical protein